MWSNVNSLTLCECIAQLFNGSLTWSRMLHSVSLDLIASATL